MQSTGSIRLYGCVAHRMRMEAEQACDDQVLNAGYPSTDYAQHLLDITRNVKIAKTTSLAAVAIARSSKIERRLRTVLAENLNRHPMTKVATWESGCSSSSVLPSRWARCVWHRRLIRRRGWTNTFRQTSTLQSTPEQLLPRIPSVWTGRTFKAGSD